MSSHAQLDLENALFGLSQDHLAPVANGHFLHQAVVTPFTQLQLSATAAGFDLQPASSFRSFDRQLAIWNAKFNGTKAIYDLSGDVVDIKHLDDWQICQAILLYSALPGASRHHWGTEIDFYDPSALPPHYQLKLITEEYTHGGFCAGLTQWLSNHSAAFGFYFPYHRFRGGVAAEPWHISYKAVASDYLAKFDIELLSTRISQTAIAGKQAIIDNLDEICSRYITNISEGS